MEALWNDRLRVTRVGRVEESEIFLVRLVFQPEEP